MMLVDMRSLGAGGSELLDTAGIASLERRLTLANEDLKALHERSEKDEPPLKDGTRDRS